MKQAMNEVAPRGAPRSSRTAGRPPVPRVPNVTFAEVPRRWLAGSVAATQVANGVNLLFPAGERFFIRSVRRYLDRLSEQGEDELVAQVRGFFGQEGRHAQAHERFFEALRAQGYDIDGILARYEHAAYAVIEKAAPPALCLSVTVALEHFTAILAEDALSGGVLEHADPAMRRLLEWHALEEIEHKSVAFDVLAKVHPSYALRMAGLALGTLTLGGFWIFATRELLGQDGTSLFAAVRELRSLRMRSERDGVAYVPESIARRVFLRGLREYVRRDFHPADKDNERLAARALARLRDEGVLPHEA
jgi:uncharacterized protein